MASEDNDDDDEESSSSSEEEEVKRPAPRGRKPQQQAMVVDQQEDLEDEEEKFEGTWEEYCYVCQDGGNVMCCEICPNVAHWKCLGFKTEPKGDWYCKDCLAKKEKKKAE